jgi:hypothetical protein
MIRRTLISAFFGWILLLFPIDPLLSQTTQPVLERFRYERPIMPGGPGPNRLQIDAALLLGGISQWQYSREAAGSLRTPMVVAKGGLSDLRIYDASDREVPYLFILPQKPGAEWIQGYLSPLAPTTETSGFQIDLGQSRLVDRLQLENVPAPFVKRCTLYASNDESRWTVLRSDATIFDLPAKELQELEIEFSQVNYRYFRIIWDDRADPPVPLPGSVSARLVAAGSLAPRMVMPIEFERRESEPMMSRYRLRLPAPGLPITEIRLSVVGGNVLRRVRILEGRLKGGEILPIVLGTATLRREMRGDLSATRMSVSINPPRETFLELMIEDGNNPPLEITGMSAVFAYLPWIYFEDSGQGPLVARYGHPKLEAPRYDLEAARSTAATTETADAQWGEARKLVVEAETQAADGMPTTGSMIDLESFRYSRSIAEGDTGLNVLPLDAAVLAHSRLVDLRIAMPDGHQIPYIMEKVEEPLSLDLPPLEKVQLPASRLDKNAAAMGTQSAYFLRLPYGNMPEARLVFTTSSRVFRRRLSILAERNPNNDRQDAWTHVIAEAPWIHASPEFDPPPISVKVPRLDTSELLVIVEEGDNNPLPITSCKLLLPSYRMRFFRTENETDLNLYYGRNDLATPRYDLAILAPRLTGAAADEISMGSESASAVPEQGSASLTVFWGILVAAVLALLVLITRLVKKA